MSSKFRLLLFLVCIPFFAAQAQTEETAKLKARDTTYSDVYRPLKPAKVAFYAAVLPGLGQAYNKDYWKIPLVYGALGTGVGFTMYFHDRFIRYRTAYKDRIAGRIDEFSIVNQDGTITQRFTEDNLIDLQDYNRRQKELSILVTAGIYILQIVEANVDAHLSQYDVDDNLSFNPAIWQSDLDFSPTFGFGLTYSF